jgi:hypothetical protein
MSWDVGLFNAPLEITIEDLPPAHVLGSRAYDCSAGDFIEDGGEDGWADFQAFRDRAFGGSIGDR